MNGLLNGKCLPSDLLVGETLADYLIRKFDDAQQQLAESHRAMRAETTAHENLQMQVEKLAAENAGLKDEISNITFMRDDDFFGSTQRAQEVMGRLVNVKTPATDAFLAEVRAQGVEMFADHLSGMNISASETSVREFAAVIRKGVQS